MADTTGMMEVRPVPAPQRLAFTLIELIAVVVILAVLAGVALPTYFNHAEQAREAADEAALAGVATALDQVHLDNRLRQAAPAEWITELDHIATALQTGALPEGLAIVGTQIEDQRGNRYDLTPETIDQPARLTPAAGGGGGGGGGGGAGGGSGGGGGGGS